jgi:hypothetical protein
MRDKITDETEFVICDSKSVADAEQECRRQGRPFFKVIISDDGTMKIIDPDGKEVKQ